MADPVQEVLNALKALYDPMGGQQAQANQYIMEFGRTAQAWQVADQLLQRPGQPETVYMWASQTLHSKLQRDFHELADAKQRQAFRNSLMAHMQRHAGGSKNVRYKLAQAMGVLCAHLTGGGEWNDSLQSLCQTLHKPETALIMLDLLTVIPEELHARSLRASREVRGKAEDAYRAFSPTILQVLQGYLGSTQDPSLQRLVFACFVAWVRMEAFAPEQLPSNPLFQNVFDAMRNPQLFDICCDAVCELLHQDYDVRGSYQPPLIGILVPKCLALLPRFEQATAQRQDEVARKLCIIFTSMGDSYLNFIVQGSPEALQCVGAILKCTAHPSKDIARITFNFWYRFTDNFDQARTAISRRKAHLRDDPPQDPQHGQQMLAQLQEQQMRLQHTAQLFHPACLEVIRHLKTAMQYPIEYERWDEEEKDEGKKIRYFSAESLLDVAGMIGGANTLPAIMQMMQQEYAAYKADPARWHGLEACLYSFRSVARKVPVNEDKVMPQLMRALPEFHSQPQLRYTATLIIGRYADWLRQHPQPFLPPLLKFVVEGLNSEVIRSSAALAFRHLCDGCGIFLKDGYAEQIFTVYENSSALSDTDRQEIITGVSSVLSYFNPELCEKALMRLLQPIAAGLGALPSKPADDTAPATAELDRLAQVLLSMKPEENDQDDAIRAVVARVLQQLFPILMQVMQHFLADDQVMERLCRCFKYAIRLADQAFLPLLVQMLNVLLDAYQKRAHSSFVYTMSICVDQFGQDPQHAELFKHVLQQCSQRTFQLLKDPQGFVDEPNVAEDYFELLSRYIRKATPVVFSHQILDASVQCGLGGLLLQHQDASVALMQFYSNLVSAAVDSRSVNEKRRPRGPPAPQTVQRVQMLLESHGAFLVSGLLRGLSGELPHKLRKYPRAVMEALLIHFTEPTLRWVGEAFQRMPETRPTKQEFMGMLYRAVSEGEAKSRPRKVNEVLKQFVEACSHR